MSVIPAKAGIQNRQIDFHLDSHASRVTSLIPVYSYNPGRAMIEGKSCVSSPINPVKLNREFVLRYMAQEVSWF